MSMYSPAVDQSPSICAQGHALVHHVRERLLARLGRALWQSEETVRAAHALHTSSEGYAAHQRAASRSGPSGACAEDRAVEQRVAHHAVPPVHAAGDLARREDAVDGRPPVAVDHDPAVLVVQHGVGVDRLGERVDAGRAVAPQHVRQRDLGVRRIDRPAVEQHRAAPVGRRDAAALVALAHDRLGHHVAGRELVDEPLAVPVQRAARRTPASSRGSSSPASSSARGRRSGGAAARRSRAARSRARPRCR